MPGAPVEQDGPRTQTQRPGHRREQARTRQGSIVGDAAGQRNGRLRRVRSAGGEAPVGRRAGVQLLHLAATSARPGQVPPRPASFACPSALTAPNVAVSGAAVTAVSGTARAVESRHGKTPQRAARHHRPLARRVARLRRSSCDPDPDARRVGRERGLRFSNAYSECPVCIPARRTLMTGVSPRTHGDRNFGERMPMPELPTLAQTFRDAGYQAAAVGKLHVYPQRNRIGLRRRDPRRGGPHPVRGHGRLRAVPSETPAMPARQVLPRYEQQPLRQPSLAPAGAHPPHQLGHRGDGAHHQAPRPHPAGVLVSRLPPPPSAAGCRSPPTWTCTATNRWTSPGAVPGRPSPRVCRCACARSAGARRTWRRRRRSRPPAARSTRCAPISTINSA